jgi:hypothetical protein
VVCIGWVASAPGTQASTAKAPGQARAHLRRWLLLACLTGYGQARGWAPGTMARARRALAVVLTSSQEHGQPPPADQPQYRRGLRPVSRGYVQDTGRRAGITAADLRADWLLSEAHASSGDPLQLTHLFGISDPTRHPLLRRNWPAGIRCTPGAGGRRRVRGQDRVHLR